jgi:hypothetical protein
MITFSPTTTEGGKDPGKPGAGIVNTDGTYSLTTYQENDGAVVGKHQLIYQPPAVEATVDPEKPLGPDESPPTSPFAGKLLKPSEVEVKAGNNTIDIELIDPM